jgi:RNA polymerase sigma factor (sigma-70 family)
LKTSKDNISDDELLDLCLAGKQVGYTVLYDRYSISVFNSIYRLVDNAHDAEDILQQVFVVVFSDIRKMKEIRSFKAWINRLAINKSISHLRKNKIYFSDVEDIVIIDTSEEDISLKRFLEYKIEDVKNAIAELPVEARTITNLFLLEDMPQEEIARILGLSHNAVRGQYHRAKKKIMQTLKNKIYHD